MGDAEKVRKGDNLGKWFPKRIDTVCLPLCVCVCVCVCTYSSSFCLRLEVIWILNTRGKGLEEGIDRIFKNVINS